MPPTSTASPTFKVLITGYGPFNGVLINPSWLCTKPLHNTTIDTPSGAKIHITALGPLRVTYEAVLKLLPLIHARPPCLPTPTEANEVIIDTSEPMPPPEYFATPPQSGYDFVFHIGAGSNGTANLEQLGHKSGYYLPDVQGQLAPLIANQQAPSESASEAALFERERLELDVESRNSISTIRRMAEGQARGFAAGYESFPEELRTEVDVEAVIAGLKRSGEHRVKASVDAGHYLCDFICYGSLAESQRPLVEKDPDNEYTKRSKSLFMHVPTSPLSPFTKDELVELVRQVVAQVCTGERAL